MKSIFYRVWDNENQKYFEPTYQAWHGELKDLHIGLMGDLFMRTMNGTIHCDSMMPGRFIVEKATHKTDRDHKLIYVGDIIDVENGEDVVRDLVRAVVGWSYAGFSLMDAAGGDWVRQLLHQPDRLKIVGNMHQVYLHTENQYFPLGVELTSKENGEMIIAPEGTAEELIVGRVTLNGLEL